MCRVWTAHACRLLSTAVDLVLPESTQAGLLQSCICLLTDIYRKRCYVGRRAVRQTLYNMLLTWAGMNAQVSRHLRQVTLQLTAWRGWPRPWCDHYHTIPYLTQPYSTLSLTNNNSVAGLAQAAV